MYSEYTDGDFPGLIMPIQREMKESLKILLYFFFLFTV